MRSTVPVESAKTFIDPVPSEETLIRALFARVRPLGKLIEVVNGRALSARYTVRDPGCVAPVTVRFAMRAVAVDGMPQEPAVANSRSVPGWSGLPVRRVSTTRHGGSVKAL